MIFSLFAKGFDPDSEICSIGVKTLSGENKIWSVENYPDEKAIISAFVDYFLKTADKIIVGFNILKFEIPVLLLKSSGLPNFKDFFKKLNSSNIEDLFVILTFQNRGRLLPMEHYLKRFGIESNMARYQAAARFFEKKEREKEKQYMENRLEAIESLFRKVWYHE